MPVFSASKQRNLVLLFCGIVGQLCLLMVSNRMGLSGHLADGMTRWDTLINPFSFIIAIGGFNLAKHWKQENKTINHLSGLSLRVYLFHANRYMRTIIMPQMINEWAESIPPPPILLAVLIVALLLFFGAVFLSVICKHTIQKILYWLCDAITLLLKRIYSTFQCR